MSTTIYVLTLTKVCPGEPTGFISDLWEDCWTDRSEAERAFKKMPLDKTYFRKELWIKEPTGRRMLLMEEKFSG